MAPIKGDLVAETNFPLYCISALDERHYLVAGGGGQAKTGVANVIEIFELKSTNNGVQSRSISRHETGIHAVMNCATFSDGRHHQLATGQDELCKTYSVKYKVVSQPKESSAGESDVRQRKDNKSETKKESTNGAGEKRLTFEIAETKEVVTDFSKDGGFQKVVRFFPDSSQLVTGGADGFIRVWKFPSLEKVREIKAHKEEIDDLDVSPDGAKIITVSREKNGSVWNAKDGKKITDLVWNQKASGAYRFRACRYGLIEGNKEKFNFYTVNIPVVRDNKSPCYITLWDSKKFAIKKAVSAGAEVISTFAVSKEGIFLGVGTISGSVSVYISFSLQRLYHVKEVHSIFVTGLEFLPRSESTRAVIGDQDFNLLSISADNSVRFHQCPERSFIHPIWIILAIAFVIYLMFYLMAELGL